jgi:hypothetical protein
MSNKLASIREQIEDAIKDLAEWQKEQGITANSEQDSSSEEQQSDASGEQQSDASEEQSGPSKVKFVHHQGFRHNMQSSPIPDTTPE